MGLETRPYSGCGMFGDKCLGFVSEDPLGDVFNVGKIVGERSEEYSLSEFPDIKVDDLGSLKIVYFTNIRYVDGCEDEIED